jgi:hypothetical protein
MSTDYKALCAELLSLLDNLAMRDPEMDGGLLRRRARTALAQPEPVEPTDEQLDKTLFRALCDYMEQESPFGGPTDEKQLDRAKARAVLARWGCPGASPPLPANYIDPEHQGEDLELLQTFYRACQAEGGTADEIHLKGIRAVLAARPTIQPEPVAPTDEEIEEWHSQCADLTRRGAADHYWAFELQGDELAGIVRAALVRWGTPANTINQEN